MTDEQRITNEIHMYYKGISFFYGVIDPEDLRQNLRYLWQEDEDGYGKFGEFMNRIPEGETKEYVKEWEYNEFMIDAPWIAPVHEETGDPLRDKFEKYIMTTNHGDKNDFRRYPNGEYLFHEFAWQAFLEGTKA